jgi:hypothetical protein
LGEIGFWNIYLTSGSEGGIERNKDVFIRMKIYIFLIFIMTVAGCVKKTPEKQINDIPTKGENSLSSENTPKDKQLTYIFDQMKRETKWQPEKNDMLWGYLFTDKNKTNLEKAANKLKAQGYTIKEIRKDEEKDFFWLHMEKIEKHTVDSLQDRNKTLNTFAQENGIESYDGWDVGPIKE